MTPHWQHFHHGADIGVRGIATTLAEAFEQAALALMAVIIDVQVVHDEQCIELHCQAPDNEILLVDWLNALIYEMATRNMLFSRFAVKIEGQQLNARAWGEAVEQKRHQPVVEVKGATFTELHVAQDEQGNWLAQCVVDV